MQGRETKLTESYGENFRAAAIPIRENPKEEEHTRKLAIRYLLSSAFWSPCNNNNNRVLKIFNTLKLLMMTNNCDLIKQCLGCVCGQIKYRAVFLVRDVN